MEVKVSAIALTMATQQLMNFRFSITFENDDLPKEAIPWIVLFNDKEILKFELDTMEFVNILTGERKQFHKSMCEENPNVLNLTHGMMICQDLDQLIEDFKLGKVSKSFDQYLNYCSEIETREMLKDLGLKVAPPDEHNNQDIN